MEVRTLHVRRATRSRYYWPHRRRWLRQAVRSQSRLWLAGSLSGRYSSHSPVSLPPWEDLLVRQSSKAGRAGGAFRDIDGRVNDGSGAEFPRRTLLGSSVNRDEPVSLLTLLYLLPL